MRRVVLALLLTLFALPATAQVEIRGLTIAPSDRPGNGGIMLKSMISIQLPGEISVLMNAADGVLVGLDKKFFRLTLREGRLTRKMAPPPHKVVGISVPQLRDLDGDGRKEVVDFRPSGSINRLVVLRYEGGPPREIASLSGYGRQTMAKDVDLTRSGTRQIVAISDTNYCLHVIEFSGETLRNIGSLSCGAPLVYNLVISDIDGDGREDLVVAREPDRIEIFLR